MNLTEFAKEILLTENIQTKIGASCSDFSVSGASLTMTVDEPGRPSKLKFGRELSRSDKFPASFEHSIARGNTLHYFANHELLALELMALCILKFPSAETAFLKGLYHTMRDEQRHLGLYIKRMNELGVEFGSLPANEFFWRTMSKMKSPSDFVAKLSLTFEQANLDHCLWFERRFNACGDFDSARLLREVYEDEISHVGHGLSWFEKWVPGQEEDDLFERHQSFLEEPLSLSRAKGKHFDQKGRKAAKLPQRYIDKLYVYNRSKGAVPDLYIFNPFMEKDLATGRVTTRKQQEVRFEREYAPVMGFLCKSHDIISTQNKLSQEFLRGWKDLGFSFPEQKVSLSNAQTSFQNLSSERKMGEIVGWGKVEKNFIDDRLGGLPTLNDGPEIRELSRLFDKTQLLPRIKKIGKRSKFFDDFINHHRFVVSDLYGFETYCEKIFSSFDSIWIKEPFGVSGGGSRLLKKSEFESLSYKGFIKKLFSDSAKRIPSEGRVTLEPCIERLLDFSVTSYVGSGPDKAVHKYQMVRSLCDRKGQYRGHYLGDPFEGLDSTLKRQLYIPRGAVHSWALEALEHVREVCTDLHYTGPFGIDCFLYRNKDGQLKIWISEINFRHTFGHVASALKKVLAGKHQYLWINLPSRFLSREGRKKIAEFGPDFFQAIPFDFEHSMYASFLIRASDLECAKRELQKLVVDPSKLDWPGL